MKFKDIAIASLATTLLFWGRGLAQQSAQTQPSTEQPSHNVQAPATPASPTSTENPATTPSPPDSQGAQKRAAKEKHWSGSLVDVTCMAKVISAGRGAGSSETSSKPDVPHFMSPGVNPSPQMGPRTGGPMGPAQGPATTPDQYPVGSPDTSQPDSAQMAKAEKVDDAAKQCVPTASTQTFGLALSDGQVMKFDDQGNAKASEAVKDTAAQPGKKVKAKVTGTMDDNDTVKVASVEVKGGKRSLSPGAAPSGR